MSRARPRRWPRRPWPPRSWRQLADARWPWNSWIEGEGPFAVRAPCWGLTITLWPTAEEAIQVFNDLTEGCTFNCRPWTHEVVDLQNLRGAEAVLAEKDRLGPEHDSAPKILRASQATQPAILNTSPESDRDHGAGQPLPPKSRGRRPWHPVHCPCGCGSPPA
jgi:hypothetical protein